RYTRRIGKCLSMLFQDGILRHRPQDVVWSNSGIHKKFERKMSFGAYIRKNRRAKMEKKSSSRISREVLDD
ncbi:MAG: hypothetical protein WBW48_23305, partial [Anaerolineae bacterium]